MNPAAVTKCRFYIRTDAGSNQYKYEPVEIASPDGDGGLHTPHPPRYGDLIFLWDSLKQQGGQYRVIERAWRHATYGSMNWPHTEELPIEGGPHIDIIVEPAEGPFLNEAPVEQPG